MRRIFDASIYLFARKGYDATTQQEIATRAGVTVGSIYRRFPDKEAILYTLLEGFGNSRTVELNQMCDGNIWRNKGLEEILLFYVDLVFSAYHLDVDMLRIMERRRLVDSVVGKLHYKLNRHAVNTFSGLLIPHFNVPLKTLQSQFRVLHTIVQGFLVYRILADPDLPDYGTPLSTPVLKRCAMQLAMNHMKLLKGASGGDGRK